MNAPVRYVAVWLSLVFVLAGPSFAAEQEGCTKFSGNVSWYGPGFHGKKTASGEIFDMNKCTCAHKTLPFRTKVLVENPKTGRTVIVKVNDRGPYVKGRVMDLSRGAAQKLGTLLGGVTYVECTILPKDASSGMLPNVISSDFSSNHFWTLATVSEQP